jgi:hypothetical protein
MPPNNNNNNINLYIPFPLALRINKIKAQKPITMLLGG